MGSGDMGLGAQSGSSSSDLAIQRMRAEQVVKAAAGWFVWIAGLSMVNSVLSISGAGLRFIFGLGIAQVVDGIAHSAENSGAVLDLIINGFVAGIFVVFWNFARKGEKWAFIVGMLLYLLDGLLLLMFKDILGIAFHAYALFRIYGGLKALPLLEQLQLATAPAGAPINPK